jgi:tetratricopeptide (TPR) repeat protein
MMPAMSGGAFAQMQAPAKIWVSRRRDGADPSTESDPVTQRMLELQRDAGNAAVAELVGQKGGAAEAVPEDPAAVLQAKAVFEQGAASYDRGQFGQAYDQFTRAYELSPRAGLLFSRAQSLRRLGGRRQEAIQLYQEYLDMGDSKRAAEATLFIEELKTPESTGDLEADTAIGRAAFDNAAKAYERGDFGYAYDEFTKSYELTKRPGLLFSRAQALRRMGGHREEAIALYGAYVALGDGNRDAEANKYIQALSTPESTGDLDKDIEISKSIFEKGAKLYDVGDFSHAYDEFTRSYELTERPTLLFSRAQAMRRIGGRREEAVALFQQYLDSGDTKRAADATRLLDELKTKGSAK